MHYNSAKKWKNKKINQLLILRDEMVIHNIDSLIIKNFLDEEYDKIQKEYNNKIQKLKKKISETKMDVYYKILFEMKSNNINNDNIEFID